MTVMSRFGTDVLLTGWGHSPFGKLPEETLESLIVGVAREAIAGAGLEASDIDEIYLGQFNSGLLPLGFASSLALQVSDDLANVPATRVENACASGSAAVHQGVKSLLAGTATTVLVIGAEKMTHAPASVVGSALLGADYELAGHESATGFAGLFAGTALAYADRYGDVVGALGQIASKNHHNGTANPYAQLHKELSVEFCQTESAQNPMVAYPLKRTDCSPISDGAAAVVLSTRPVGGALTPPVRLRAFAQANDFLPAAKRDPTAFAGSAAAWHRALAMAGITLDDLDLVELHDCFTIAELIMYEVMGLTPAGQGSRALDEGWVHRDGLLPVNLSGGLKSKGHPVGATGVSQHVLAAMQLTGTAGAMQLPSARMAAVHNMGGLAVANYVSVLEGL
ncbi:acetyl-CoA acetyltransferase [Herbiconiux sp. CPCC 203407]|uniref:Acetyl-CoA acetyltransferase n=1 Tax=Herbiconiux oxytropis TaxID=2970915 RepID=A0AA41XFV3_9MICO|nr:acetyl-CoA acetyltransferase [Herbiconiux oxytropis]MCS5720765.1 acetyl-CoA acetyltransferase [Herbiconiux oxytropis]MCS5724908.1 acetyl-CoA acetyltransferase [Herbiconiux oxytropis]